MAREPAHLARMVKACPRPGCGSSNVKWRYYNNKQHSQPRYLCLGCNELFTFGGKIRPSKEEKLQAAPREAHVGGAARRKKGPRIKITHAKNSSSYVRPMKELRLMMEYRPKNKIRSPNNLSAQSASSISKPKRMRGGVILLRLATGSVIRLPDSSSDEKCQIDADADMKVSPTELEEMFVGFENVVNEFEEMFGGPEALEPESKVVDGGSAASGAGALNDQLEAVEDGGPGFNWTSSEQMQSPTVRCGGSLERSELLDSELESLLIDTGFPCLSWEDIDNM